MKLILRVCLNFAEFKIISSYFEQNLNRLLNRFLKKSRHFGKMPGFSFACVRRLHGFHRHCAACVFYHCAIGIGVERARMIATYWNHYEVAVAQHTVIRAFAVAYGERLRCLVVGYGDYRVVATFVIVTCTIVFI